MCSYLSASCGFSNGVGSSSWKDGEQEATQPAHYTFFLLAYLYKEVTFKVFVCMFNKLNSLLSATRD